MKNMYLRILGVALLFSLQAKSQNLYFPPLTGTTWDTISPNRLGWCQPRIDSLYLFLQQKNSKAFIVLKGGKIVLEKYFGTFTQDSAWYWASAGKTLTAFATGIAERENLLALNNKTSDYLGTGWTVAPLNKENLITLKHQLTMTTGLDENVPDDNCVIDTCLKYKADAGTQWYYYNAPYRLMQDVLAKAANSTFQAYYNSRIAAKTGIAGQWINYTFYSKPRNMARFGLLLLNKGTWVQDSVLKNNRYFQEMISSSQNLNPSYGYLTWLNGKSSFMMPGTSLVFQGPMFPDAPMDMYCALGKNDQKIYVVPSQQLVVIRMGNSAGTASLAASSFDNMLWKKINQLSCQTTGMNESSSAFKTTLYPNPTRVSLNVTWSDQQPKLVEIISTDGQLQMQQTLQPNELLNIANLNAGVYILTLTDPQSGQQSHSRFVKY